MCGFIIAYSKRSPLKPKQCIRSLRNLDKRGPDFSYHNFLLNDHLFFGQTVLSITGSPTKEIDNYYISKSHGKILAFNGEIYNFRQLDNELLEPRGFKSKTGTDTETLINLHDHVSSSEVFETLNGMYSYVVVDAKNQEITIGRDPIGEKFCYVYENNNYLLIASEVLPILEFVHPEIDCLLLKEYFNTRHLLTDKRTSFQNIKVVPAGTLTSISLKSYRRRLLFKRTIDTFISESVYREYNHLNKQEIETYFDSILESNARKLLPNNINRSIVISGGIDSSLGAHYLNQAIITDRKDRGSNHFIGLTFGAKDLVAKQLPLFSKRLGVNIDIQPISLQNYAECLKDCLTIACSPLPTHSFVSQSLLAQCARSQNSKVLIGGEGADELFGGYEQYTDFPVAPNITTNPSAYSGYISVEPRFDSHTSSRAASLDDEWRESINAYSFLEDSKEKVFQAALLTDSRIQLESVGIRSADTASMMHSVESRSFYLSEEMIKFALNLPIKYKLKPGQAGDKTRTKPILKELFAEKYSRDLIFQKQGFSGFPNEAGRVLTNENYQLAKDVLELTNENTQTILSSRSMEWKLQNVELFLRTYG